jgi:hypothetical protein
MAEAEDLLWSQITFLFVLLAEEVELHIILVMGVIN